MIAPLVPTVARPAGKLRKPCDLRRKAARVSTKGVGPRLCTRLDATPGCSDPNRSPVTPPVWVWAAIAARCGIIPWEAERRHGAPGTVP